MYVTVRTYADKAALIDGLVPRDVLPYNYDDPWVLTLPHDSWTAIRIGIGGVAYDRSTKSIFITQRAGETAWWNVGNNPLFWKFTHP